MNDATPSSDLEIALGDLSVHINMDQGSFTIGRGKFFDWHVDTDQLPIEPGLDFFLLPNRNQIDLRVDQRFARYADVDDGDYREVCQIADDRNSRRSK
ncbi:hypothetical protein [Solemya velum gill symbiont]|uniref:hypothetical protein n=1 Tax=Solemya velum gill symbiont TaxID=2340 RepID=UPI0009988CE4|nr:hypothetical protein [Solemya velum gill symbiont]OOZ43294.1 hypothetical protein BOW37_11595 [Solemya velum gill symbiont]OOZ44288.1 hypothetical protein BOW38_11690 [Solemya velum gill symbiont]OOZ48059.1 hypothetical protein BOW39_12600 [Solemya velum gill symbiont]OOZ49540.1 hypothetical protein BOW40_11630 [Solemya velum gill symbiont]OOZ53079.1 hypothetical protein BOW41_11780 [Solemya velum gill symbiont]